MKMLERKETRVDLGDIDIYDFEGNLENAIEMLENLRSDNYTKIVIQVDANFYDGEDGHAILDIYGYRMETDEELNARIDSHNRVELQKYLNEQKKIEDEKKLLEELKQKYEK